LSILDVFNAPSTFSVWTRYNQLKVLSNWMDLIVQVAMSTSLVHRASNVFIILDSFKVSG